MALEKTLRLDDLESLVTRADEASTCLGDGEQTLRPSQAAEPRPSEGRFHWAEETPKARAVRKEAETPPPRKPIQEQTPTPPPAEPTPTPKKPTVHYIKSRPPPVPSKNHEQLTVKERDLRRYGHDLNQLRRCHLTQPPSETPAEKSVKALSFKSAYVLRCRSPTDIIDPWKDLPNPDVYNRLASKDSNPLHQQWVDPKLEVSPRFPGPESPPKKHHHHVVISGAVPAVPMRRAQSEVTVRARSCSNDAALSQSPQGADFTDGHRRHRHRHREHKTALPHVEDYCDRSHTPNRGGHRGGRGSSSRPSSRSSRRSSVGPSQSRERGSRPGSNEAALDQAARFVRQSRIQPVDKTACEEDLGPDISRDIAHVGSKAQRRFVRRLEDHELRNFHDKSSGSRGSSTRAVWLSLDPCTGEVNPYPTTVSSRIEAAYSTGRCSVPLGGLGLHSDDAIVRFQRCVLECTSLDGRQAAKEESWGELRDVLRIPVRATTDEISVEVYWKDEEFAWRIAERQHVGPTELRRIALSGDESVPPPAPALPPVDPDRRLFFINPGAFVEAY